MEVGACLGHGLQFGLFPSCVAQPDFADVFSLAKDTVTFVYPFLSACASLQIITYKCSKTCKVMVPILQPN